MTAKKVIGFGCGGIVVVVLLLIVVGVIWLGSGPESGVKLSNEMDEYALKYLDEHGILNPDEDLIAYYDVTLGMDGTEAVILTTKRVIYHRKGQNDVIELSAIDDVKHRKEPLIGDVIEVYASDGKSMKIEIAPLNQGETFRTALMRAWQNQREGEAGTSNTEPAATQGKKADPDHPAGSPQ